MDNLIYLIILGVFVLISFIDTLFLNWRFKKINVANVSYKKTLLISLAVKVIIFLTLFIVPLFFELQDDFESLILPGLFSIIVSFFVFKKLLNKYYSISLKQNISIYIPYIFFLMIILATPREIRFISEVGVVIVNPNEIGKFCHERGVIGCEPSLICEYSYPCAGSACPVATDCAVKYGSLPEKCKEQVTSSGDCFSIGQGFQYNKEKGACEISFGNGCGTYSPFKTLDECNKVCELNISNFFWHR
jgi:hypothetical protein